MSENDKDSIYSDERFEELGKIAPHSPETEVALLGSIIMDNDCLNEVSLKIQPSDFYLKRHQRIYRAMLDLHSNNDNMDYVTLYNALKVKYDKEEAYGGLDYLTELPGRISYIPSITNYIDIIKKHSIRRAVIRLSRKAIEKCYDSTLDATDIFDFVQSELSTLNKSTIVKEPQHIVKYMRKIVERLKDDVKNKGELIGLPTGIKRLDEMTLGLQDGTLTIIAGRPSHGKTSLAISFIRYQGADQKIPVLLFSAEMGAVAIAQNALAEISRAGLRGIQTGIIPLHEEKRVNAGITQLGESKIYIDDSVNISVERIKSVTRQMVLDHEIKAIYIDHLQLLKMRKTQNLVEAMSETVNELKQLAREQNIPVILLSQINRETEKRQGTYKVHEPKLSEIKGTGTAEQTADVVIIIHRPYFHSKKRDDIGKDELIIAKNRRGEIGNVAVEFKPFCVRFDQREEEHDYSFPDTKTSYFDHN